MTISTSQALAGRVLTLFLAGVLTACGDTSTGASEAATSATSASPEKPQESESPAPGALPEELQRTWLLDVPRDRVLANLRKSGFGKFADRFVRSEGLAPRVRMAMTLYEDYFSIAWRMPHGVWDEGWYGSAALEGDVLTMHDDYYEGVSDSFGYVVDGATLRLSFQSTTGDVLRGIPSEAYSRAYFGQPWVEGDCGPSDLTAC